MAVLDPKETYKNLTKKGFEDMPQKSSDHKYIVFKHNGIVICHTKISHGTKEIGDNLIKKMAYQVKLDKKRFVEFAKCKIDLEEYINILKNTKALPTIK